MFGKITADIAFKQDRERFFREADKFEMVSYLSDRLTEKEKSEQKKKKRDWRNMTELKGYPDIDFPLYIPSFVKVKTFSTHKKGEEESEFVDPDFS